MSSSRKDLPFVTLLVLNYNGRKYLPSCLDSLLKTDYPKFEVVVIDNCSSDNSVEFVKKNYPNVRIIENGENIGYACAINSAMEIVEGECVVFLNNDIVVEPSWLKQLIPYISVKDVAAVNPKILFLDYKKVINAAGGSCDVYGVGWNRGNGEFDKGQYGAVEEVFYVNGTAMLTRKDIWKDVGPFDERYFLYGEDLDWCWRARLKGYKLLYVPSARIYHRWRGSRGPIIEFLEKHWLANFLKNYSVKTICVLFPKYLVLKFLKAMWLMKNGRGLREKFAVFQGFRWNLANFKCTWTKHLLVQVLRKVSDKEIQKCMYKGSFELSAWVGKIEHPLARQFKMQNYELTA
ncbi:MAG: glycosyltransferase family 2 protein [Candidatus Bathycorpusculaceae bacterium]